MGYPVAYRSARAVEQAGRGFQTPARPRPWVAGPWDRPATQRVPSSGFEFGIPKKILKAANDNRRLLGLALRGIRLAARFHPWWRFANLLWDLKGLLHHQTYGWAWSTQFTVTHSCAPGGAWSGNSCTFCCADQAIVSFGIPTNMPPGTAAATWLFQYFFGGNPAAPRYRQGIRIRNDGATTVPGPRPFVVNPAHPPMVPWIKIEEWELGTPAPLPWRLVPKQEPHPDAPEPIRRKTGPEPSEGVPPVPQPRYDPFEYPRTNVPDIWIIPRRGANPLPSWWTPPAPTPVRPAPRPAGNEGRPATPPRGHTEEHPEPGVTVRTAPGHLFRKPGAREKETKRPARGSLAAAYRALAKGFGHVTEFSDALKCVYDALPEKLRKRERAKRHGKDPSMQGKVQIIYRNASSLNITAMLGCMAKEQLQDWAIGKMAKTHAEARKRYGIRGGYMSRLSKLPSVHIP